VSSRRHRDIPWIKVYRADAFTKQDGSCAYCGERLRARDATADHCKPVTRGGLTTRANIAMACKPCNSAKGQMSVRAFKKRIRKPTKDDPWSIWKAWSRWRLSERAKLAEKRILRWNKVK
jgi:5-methylcytosine-specific restriction endonuclease McrA